MLKVLHSVLSLEVGGLENGVVNLVNNAPEDMQVDILCLRARGTLADRITLAKARVLMAPNLEDHSIKTAIQTHIDVLAEGDYDIIHTHGWSTMLAGALAAWILRLKRFGKRPLVVNGEHGVFYDQGWKKRFFQRLLFNRMDGNLSVSADLGLRMEAAFGLKAQTFHCILNGVDVNRFSPNAEVRSQRRQEFGFTDQELVIGTVGRLVAIKNYPMLIQSFAALKQQYQHLRLLFCGDGQERKALEALVDELGLSQSVTFAGRIDYVAEAMQTFDIFALTSDMEGLPNTLLEAMATGVPSIVTDVGGSREVMPESGGILVKAGDLEQFLASLTNLVESPDVRTQFASNALEHVRGHLSLQAMADGYYDYYRQLAARY